ncbi:GntR family transcriptional regulator [Defluviitalea saccharophila]|uniref:GntR family transcriptional regulator n=1 Tax=Defluviitalea saccharophila TaxID=879970 RepID=A0ABZ2Y6H2_9FIRM|nr:GntR family transcriptional regulator [Candidatus Epulonipiscium sp.]
MHLTMNPISNIGDSIYFGLRKQIIELNLKPGEPLVIKEIAQKLEVSRSPVRDSIIKLSKEGLVDILAQRGTYVSKIDLKRVEEEQFIRSSLEEKAILLFMKQYNEYSIIQLENLIEMQITSLKNQDYTSFLDYDDAFHSIFFKTAERDMSWNLIESISGHYRRLRLITLWDLETSEEVIRQHRQIIQYIKEKNVDMILQSTHQHFTRIVSQTDYIVEKYPTYFKQKSDENFLSKNFGQYV